MGLNDIMKIGSVIKKLRTEKGFTQKKMAELLNIPYSTYSNYENNNRTPDVDTLMGIADMLGVEVWDLFGVDEKTARISNLDYTDNGDILVTTQLSDTVMEILYYLGQLNEKGQDKALEQVEMLAKIPEYTRDDQQALDNYMEFIKDKHPDYWKQFRDTLRKIEKTDD